MASNMPLPIPPRTPTPPPDDEIHDAVGLGLDHNSLPKFSYNPAALSPISATFPPQQFGTLGVPAGAASSNLTPSLYQRGMPLSPSSSSFPNSPYSDTTAMSANQTPMTGTSETFHSPFNFTPQQYSLGKPPSKAGDVGRRRGHKYKHSSVSHQIILEPPPRPPLQLPASLPIPTWKEYWSSRSKEQSLRCVWCACHLFVSAFVLWEAHECLSLTVLSRLLFFDALGAILCVTVDIGNNFEAWKRSSIRHPFGFERAEVLAGLGMSVGLLFMGLDLISHGLTHALENVGSHESHHVHGEHGHDEHASVASINIAAFSAIGTTLVSAMVLKNHARIEKVMRLGYISWLPSILNNPSHLMTLSCSFSLVILSLIPHDQTYTVLDRGLSFTLSICMIALGWHLGWTLGKMLMMSYSGPDVSLVLDELSSDPAVTGIDEAKFWQVHYGLCQVNLKLRVRKLDDIVRLRDRVSSLVRNRLGGGYGTGGAGQKWEVSTQISLDKHVH